MNMYIILILVPISVHIRVCSANLQDSSVTRLLYHKLIEKQIIIYSHILCQ